MRQGLFLRCCTAAKEKLQARKRGIHAELRPFESLLEKDRKGHLKHALTADALKAVEARCTNRIVNSGNDFDMLKYFNYHCNDRINNYFKLAASAMFGVIGYCASIDLKLPHAYLITAGVLVGFGLIEMLYRNSLSMFRQYLNRVGSGIIRIDHKTDAR